MEGKILAHFRIIDKLGEGGMGVVYKAEDQKLGRLVALKVLRPSFVGDDERHRRFLQEARTAAAVSHPNIASIYEIGESEGTTFIAMEFVEGETLRARLASGELPVADAIRIGAAVSDGLAAAHDSGVVHRDLKPDNVMIGLDGHARILDFGLAKLLEEPDPTDDSDSSISRMDTMPQQLTREGRVFGTAAYMSPEQARGKPVDFRSDIFSFGAMLYEMVTGRVPFKGETISDTITMILRDPAVPVSEIQREVPGQLDWIVGRCLQKSPDERYGSTRELMTDLKELRRETDTGVSQTGERSASTSGYSHSGYTSYPTGYGMPPSGSGSGPIPTSGPFPAAAPSGGRRMGQVAILGALIVLLAFLGYRAFIQDRGPDEPTAPALDLEANSLAVLTFDNKSDPEDTDRMGQILQELVITDLSSVQNLKVFSGQRLYDIQKMLTGRDGRGFDPEVATQVAERAGAETMLTGSLTQLGERWILTYQLVDVATGTVRSSKRIDGDDLYAMVDDLTTRVRGDTQMALASGAVEDASVRDKTSASLEAYQHFLAGVDHLNEMEFDAAVASFDSAVTIDPDFSRAYYQLALAKWWAGDSGEEAEQPLTRLLDGDFNLDDKQRGMAEASLALVNRRWDEAIDLYQGLAERYPDEKDAWYGLGEACFHSANPRYTDALEAFVRCVRLDPNFFLGYRHMFDVYEREGMVEETVTLARLLTELDEGNPRRYGQLVQAIAQQGDEAALAQVVAEARERFPDEWSEADFAQIEAWARLEVADYMAARAGFQRAIEEFETEKEAISAYRGLMRTAMKLREFEEAEELIVRVKTIIDEEGLQKKYAEVPSRDLIELYMEQGRVRDALALIETWRQSDMLPPEAAIPEVFFRTLAGEEAEASHLVAEVRDKLSMNDAAGLSMMHGLGYFQCGAYQHADSIFHALADEMDETSSSELLAGLGYAAIGLQNYPEAERYLLQALSANPRDQQVLPILSVLYTIEGRYEDAVAYAEQAMAFWPGDPGSHIALVSALVHSAREAEAEEALARAREVLTPGAYRWLLVGYTWDSPTGLVWQELAVERPDWAARLVEEAARLDPDGKDPAVALAQGALALNQGDLETARRRFARGYEVAHPSSHLRRDNGAGLATVSLLEGKLDEAEIQVRKVIEEGPAHVRTQRLLAYILAEQGRYDEALALSERMLTLDPGYASHCLLAWVLVASERDVDRARELAEWAASMDKRVTETSALTPYGSPVEHVLGLAALRGGRLQEAVDLLERAEASHPQRGAIQADLQEARARLARGSG